MNAKPLDPNEIARIQVDLPGTPPPEPGKEKGHGICASFLNDGTAQIGGPHAAGVSISFGYVPRADGTGWQPGDSIIHGKYVGIAIFRKPETGEVCITAIEFVRYPDCRPPLEPIAQITLTPVDNALHVKASARTTRRGALSQIAEHYLPF